MPDISFIKGKTIEQQQLQSILRLRELAVRQKTASGNQLKALLLEFNIRAGSRNGGVRGVIESVLEELIEQHEDCKRLLKLEGVSVINAVNLYIALGCADLAVFSKEKMRQRASA